MNIKPILALDFDGTCTTFQHGWQGYDKINDPPVKGLFEFLEEAIEYFDVYIFSTRSANSIGTNAMKQWFDYHFLYHKMKYPDAFGHHMAIAPLIYFSDTKPPAFVTLDDCAITFNGVFPDARKLLSFCPWHKTEITNGKDMQEWKNK